MIENYLAHQGELAPHSQGADKSSLEFAAKISDRATEEVGQCLRPQLTLVDLKGPAFFSLC